ncbi:glycosyltransferase [uncultured Microscilla sp.]|uniref:glycosyltransferase family protein n=1 Tax=uncultured Microscilla sp. TaxID=432653 RepID=UPI0026273B35|nr:glycosyltransferase [uncultured Microscilla sp.]
MKSKKKVFLGLTNIASQIQDWQQGFEANGFDTFTAIHEVHASFVTKENIQYDISSLKNNYEKWYDKVRPYKLRFLLQYLAGEKYKLDPVKYVYKKAIEECDTFVFIWSSFYPDFQDYRLLKQMGKKIITIFVGSDVRWYQSMKQDFAHYNVPPIEYAKTITFDENYLNQRLLYMRTAEKYADIIVSNPTQSQLALRPYHKGFVMMNPEIFPHKPTQRHEKPLLMHAPSNSDQKGTKYILETIDKLRDEGFDFDFKLIQNLPYMEAIKEYARADIFIGQLLIPQAGKQDREALACGKVVLTSINYDYANEEEDCPFIDINPQNIYQELKSVLNDYPRRCKLAAQGRKYIEKHHTPANIVKDIVKMLEVNEEERSYIFKPTFFRNDFSPEREYLDLYNQWTRYVKDCNWYKKHVPSGEHNRLIF